MNTTINEIISYTQNRVNTWYENAKIDYNIDGNAYVVANETEVSIVFTEDDVTDTFSLSLESVQEEAVDYLFNVWAEQA